MRKLLPFALGLAAACGGAATTPPTTPPPGGGGAAGGAGSGGVRGGAVVAGEGALATRAKPITGSHAMVVSGHPLASQVGVEILRSGGNAVDAAVAVGFALSVVLPEAGNIGGGGFIVYRDTSGRVRALDYRETAPTGSSRLMYVDSTGNPTEQSLTGHLAAGVPGSVAGLYEAWKTAGHLPWRAVVAPAIRLAPGHVLDYAPRRPIAHGADRLRP